MNFPCEHALFSAKMQFGAGSPETLVRRSRDEGPLSAKKAAVARRWRSRREKRGSSALGRRPRPS